MATATATARFPRHHALRYRKSLATPLATAVAVAVATKADTVNVTKPRLKGEIVWFFLYNEY